MATCRCGEQTDGFPVLIARDIPHQIRHASIFGALDSLPSGGGMILVAPHEPLPLLAQVDKRYGNAFEIDYLEEGPVDWKLQFVRK